jgi:gliding motility-associated peptidyl-prolyl isomerase|tara:strand:- start:63 stop:593 length:531 start_codon:yes stop_codon:yes gene_type:complete
MKINIFLLLVFLCFSCNNVQPRKPINKKPSTTLLKATAQQTKALNTIEDKKIEQLILNDSLALYYVSKNGFWYTYNHKKEGNLPTPQLGNEVSFEYGITDLNDSIIYSKEELGIINYKVDKEDFISAIQKGIKLMKIGETITFVIPFYNAYGISGDGNKIGVNQSIKSTITLLNIK